MTASRIRRPAWQQLQIVPDAPAALAALKAAGWLLVGVTNQPDVARGTQQRAVVEAINAAVLAALPLQDIFVCYHDARDECECRKPRPGLLHQAAAMYGSDLAASVMIGDRWKDVEAGQRAGCATVLIDCGYAEPQPGAAARVYRSLAVRGRRLDSPSTGDT